MAETDSTTTSASFVSSKKGKESTISFPSTTFLCDICADEKPNTDDTFTILGCDHSYCSDCVAKYIDSKLQESVVSIACPVSGCKGSLEPEICQSILPKQVFDRWCDALCESMIVASEKIYCPFKDCWALLIDARPENEDARESECPECHRLFCGECKVPWHASLTCKEYQKGLNIDEGGMLFSGECKVSSKRKHSPAAKVSCEICADEKGEDDMFTIVGCDHSYCSDCVSKYVDSKLQENIVKIACPFLGCKGSLDPQTCHSVLPKQVFDRWCDALCDSLIVGPEKFYCPFKDCSALLIDARFENEGGFECECPECHRLFCGECRVPWHASLTCNEYQSLSKDERTNEDIKLMNLANEKKWRRCPKCRIYVQRLDGCVFIRCRCGHCFCYNCGVTLIDHFCKICNQ